MARSRSWRSPRRPRRPGCPMSGAARCSLPCGTLAASLRLYEALAERAGESPESGLGLLRAAVASTAWAGFAGDATGDTAPPLPASGGEEVRPGPHHQPRVAGAVASRTRRGRSRFLWPPGISPRALDRARSWIESQPAALPDYWFEVSSRLAQAAGSAAPPWLSLLEAEREIAGGRLREAQARLEAVAQDDARARINAAPHGSGWRRRPRREETCAPPSRWRSGGSATSPGRPPPNPRALCGWRRPAARAKESTPTPTRILDQADRQALGLALPERLENALTRATVLSLQGRFDEEKALYEAWRPAVARSGEETLMARLLSREALGLNDRREFASAAARLEQASEVLRDDPVERTRVLIDLAATFYHSGRTGRCDRLLEEAIACAALAGREDLSRIARANRLELLIHRCEWSRAASEADALASAAREEGDELRLLVAIHQSSRLALRTGGPGPRRAGERAGTCAGRETERPPRGRRAVAGRRGPAPLHGAHRGRPPRVRDGRGGSARPLRHGAARARAAGGAGASRPRSAREAQRSKSSSCGTSTRPRSPSREARRPERVRWLTPARLARPGGAGAAIAGRRCAGGRRLRSVSPARRPSRRRGTSAPCACRSRVSWRERTPSRPSGRSVFTRSRSATARTAPSRRFGPVPGQPAESACRSLHAGDRAYQLEIWPRPPEALMEAVALLLETLLFRVPPAAAIGGHADGWRRLGIVAADTSMEEPYRRLSLFAAQSVTVLVLGESGTGKEAVARAVHSLSARASRAFIAVNVAAIPAPLLESELFGHVRGAFTGADRDRRGLIEDASGGTIFFDEIADLALPLQAKLLRALQEGEIRRVGETRSRPVDVRIVSATARDLSREVQAWPFPRGPLLPAARRGHPAPPAAAAGAGRLPARAPFPRPLRARVLPRPAPVRSRDARRDWGPWMAGQRP